MQICGGASNSQKRPADLSLWQISAPRTCSDDDDDDYDDDHKCYSSPLTDPSLYKILGGMKVVEEW